MRPDKSVLFTNLYLWQCDGNFKASCLHAKNHASTGHWQVVIDAAMQSSWESWRSPTCQEKSGFHRVLRLWNLKPGTDIISVQK